MLKIFLLHCPPNPAPLPLPTRPPPPKRNTGYGLANTMIEAIHGQEGTLFFDYLSFKFRIHYYKLQ